jgi:threonine dehydratase
LADPAPALPVSADDVRRAAAAIEGAVVRTPSARSETLSEITGAEVTVKFENLQFTASYKERGARNRLLELGDAERARGVVTMSAGNYAQAVARHAGLLGVRATIVMPEATPTVKAARTAALGATVVRQGASLAESQAEARRLAERDGMVLLSPYDDAEVIAGQGTVALELLEDHPDLEVLVLPVGGGGLLAGCAVIARDLAPGIEIVGVQTERYPSMVNALRGEHRPCGGPTIADGIAVATAGELTSAIAAALVDDVFAVPESRIEEAVGLYLEIEKVVAEGAGATALAGLLDAPERFRGRRVGIVLSGGNIDLRLLASVVMRGMVRTGRLGTLRVQIPDRPGSLARLSQIIGERGGNIVEIRHHRWFLDVSSLAAEVEVTIETAEQQVFRGIVAALRASQLQVEVVDEVS